MTMYGIPIYKNRKEILEPKGNPPGTVTMIAVEDPSTRRGRNVGEFSVKYSNEFVFPVLTEMKQTV